MRLFPLCPWTAGIIWCQILEGNLEEAEQQLEFLKEVQLSLGKSEVRGHFIPPVLPLCPSPAPNLNPNQGGMLWEGGWAGASLVSNGAQGPASSQMLCRAPGPREAWEESCEAKSSLPLAGPHLSPGAAGLQEAQK